MKKAFELGIQVPNTFEGWADFFPRYTVLPWLKGAQHQRVQRMREYLRIAFNRIPIGVQTETSRESACSPYDQSAGPLAPGSWYLCCSG